MNADNAEVLRSGGSSGVAGISTFMSRTPDEWLSEENFIQEPDGSRVLLTPACSHRDTRLFPACSGILAGHLLPFIWPDPGLLAGGNTSWRAQLRPPGVLRIPGRFVTPLGASRYARLGDPLISGNPRLKSETLPNCQATLSQKEKCGRPVAGVEQTFESHRLGRGRGGERG